jgi:hypothetical protein
MADRWMEEATKANEPRCFDDEANLQLSEDSRKTQPHPSHTPSPRFEESRSDFDLVNPKDNHLPDYRTDLPFHVSINKILDTFEQTCAAAHFQIIEQGGAVATAVRRERIRLIDVILCCFSHEKRIQAVTAIRLQVSVNESQHTRTVLLKGVYGDSTTMIEFIEGFKVRLEPMLVLGALSPRRPADSQDFLASEKMLDEDESSFSLKTETNSFYHFHKVLSSETSDLSKTVSSFLSSFTSQYEDPVEGSKLLPQPMEAIKLLIDETVEALFSQYTPQGSKTERIMQYCRPAVERFVFAKVLQPLEALYRYQNRELDAAFRKKTAFLKQFDIQMLMEQLEIKERLRLRGHPRPYQAAIDTMSGLSECYNPLEKLNCLFTCIASMKTAVVDYWRGKTELEAMDDLLPLQILIVACSGLETPAAEIRLLQDYVGKADCYENESMLLTNIEVSIRYVALEWP